MIKRTNSPITDFMSVDEMYNAVYQMAGVSLETLEAVTNLNGYTKKTLLDLLYVTTGYRDFDQLPKNDSDPWYIIECYDGDKRKVVDVSSMDLWSYRIAMATMPFDILDEDEEEHTAWIDAGDE